MSIIVTIKITTQTNYETNEITAWLLVLIKAADKTCKRQLLTSLVLCQVFWKHFFLFPPCIIDLASYWFITLLRQKLLLESRGELVPFSKQRILTLESEEVVEELELLDSFLLLSSSSTSIVSSTRLSSSSSSLSRLLKIWTFLYCHLQD